MIAVSEADRATARRVIRRCEVKAHSGAPFKWIVAARHEAFGIEGRREYSGTESGARRAAAKIARAAGHGWTSVVFEVRS